MKRLFVAAFCLLAVAAFADEKKADAKKPEAKPAPAEAGGGAPPPPAKELADAMSAFEGSWKCTGKALDSPMGKGHPMEATCTTKVDLGGYWYVARFDETKTKDSPMPYAMWSAVGFDPSKKLLTRADFDSFGGVTHVTSKGWEGDKLVWEGKITGFETMGFRETVTKKAGALSSVLEFSGKDGKWFKGVEYTCKK